MFNITADSTPVYDTFGPAAYWAGSDWVQWHKLMVVKYGRAKADTTWTEAWLAGLDTNAGGYGTAPGSGAVFDSVPVSARTTDPVFRAYINANPKLYQVVYSGMAGQIMAPVNAGQTWLGSISKSIAENPSTVTYALIGIGALAALYAVHRLTPNRPSTRRSN